VHPTLATLESDERLIAAWEGYHLIGAAMRSERIRPEYRRIRACVSERIAAEPPLRGPKVHWGRALRLGPLVSTALAICTVSAAILAVPQLFDLGPDADSVPGRGLGKDVLCAGMPDLGALWDHYGSHPLGEAQVAGRYTQMGGVTPRDRLRYGYRFYPDRESGLSFKSDLMGQRTEPIEQVTFTALDLLPSRESASAAGPVPQRRRSGPEPPSPDLLPWRFDALPPGFSLVMHNDWRAAGGQPVDHFVLSDGLASVSVYVEAGNPQEGLEGGTHIGAVHAIGKRVSGHQITVVGEVPPETVETVLAGIRRAPEGQR